ncbi:hypothetical protein AB3S75_013308 [Citrus x aurantiifolia]
MGIPRIARASGPANLRSASFKDLFDFVDRKEAEIKEILKERSRVTEEEKKKVSPEGTSVSPHEATILMPEGTRTASPEETTVTPAPVGTLLELGEDTFELSVFRGDWKSAKRFIEKDRSVLIKPISVLNRTALLVVACEGNWEFMEELVNVMGANNLGMVDELGCTALHYAAVGGSIKACKALVRKKRALTQTVSNRGWTPLLSAAHCAPKDKDVVYYLSTVTTNEPPGCPFAGPLADIVLHLIDSHSNFATAKDDEGHNILDALVLRPQDFRSGTDLGSWKNWIYPLVPVEMDSSAPWSARIGVVNTTVFLWPRKLYWNCIELLAPGIKQVWDAKLTHKVALKLAKHVFKAFSNVYDVKDYVSLHSNTITAAASSGIVEIVKMCLQMFPHTIWLSIDQQTILKVAVQHRQEKILNLVHNMVVYNKFTSPQLIDVSTKDTILHLAAKLAPPANLRIVPGVALQMQREVQWFKEVEKLVHPFLKEAQNVDGKTAQDIFTEQHKDLLENSEKWMKDTLNSCMVVTALIATIMFAAAYTVPGGNNESGIPIFLRDKLFMVFAISDALGLIFSSTSLLVFLSIQTARYAEEDFLESLPKKLIIGLASLFLSIVNMMISYVATFSIVLHDRSKWLAITVPILASLPVTIYALLQLPLFVQMYQSTYGSGIFRRVKI